MKKLTKPKTTAKSTTCCSAAKQKPTPEKSAQCCAKASRLSTGCHD